MIPVVTDITANHRTVCVYIYKYWPMIPVVADVTANHRTAIIRLFTRGTDPCYFTVITLQQHITHSSVSLCTQSLRSTGICHCRRTSNALYHVCLSVCLSVCPISFESIDLETSIFTTEVYLQNIYSWMSSIKVRGSKVKVTGSEVKVIRV